MRQRQLNELRSARGGKELQHCLRAAETFTRDKKVRGAYQIDADVPLLSCGNYHRPQMDKLKPKNEGSDKIIHLYFKKINTFSVSFSFVSQFFCTFALKYCRWVVDGPSHIAEALSAGWWYDFSGTNNSISYLFRVS